MLDYEKLDLVKVLSGETDESTISAYLEIAGSKICRRAYPYNPEITDVPSQYGHLQVEIAVYLLNKRGADGETAHSEGGISRSYEDADVPSSMLRSIVPMAGALS